MTIEEQLQRLTSVVESLAASVGARDNQLDALTNITRELSIIASKHDAQIAAHAAQIGELVEFSKNLKESFANMERQWQAYLNTLPRN